MASNRCRKLTQFWLYFVKYSGRKIIIACGGVFLFVGLLVCLVLIWWQTQFFTFLHTLSYSFLKHKADANILTLQVRKSSQTLNPFLSTPSCHRFPRPVARCPAMKTSEFTLVLTPSSTRLTVPITVDCLWPYSVSLIHFIFTFSFHGSWRGDMPQWTRALAAIPEYQGSVPSTPVAFITTSTPAPGANAFLEPPWAQHACGTQTYIQTKAYT